MKSVKINDFNYFKIGTIFNPITPSRICAGARVHKHAKKITIEYPARLNAMAIDPSKITENHNMIYSPGEIVFSTRLFLEVTVELIDEALIEIHNVFFNKDSVIKHSCLIMKEAINYKGGFKITIEKYHNYRHCGLGSTGSLQAAIATCINHLFDFPFAECELIKYLARNYGEEIDNDDGYLNPVQCIGGSAASGLYKGGVLVLAGENIVIAEGEIPDCYQVLIGIPGDLAPNDSVSQFNDEKENLHKFSQTGELYRNQIAYNVLHKFLPAVKEKNISKMGDVIFDYRYNMGSIKNCSYTYPDLVTLMNNLAFLKHENHVDILSISSVGPAVFAILREDNMDFCKQTFKEQNLNIIETRICNEKYRVKNIE